MLGYRNLSIYVKHQNLLYIEYILSKFPKGYDWGGWREGKHNTDDNIIIIIIINEYD